MKFHNFEGEYVLKINRLLEMGMFTIHDNSELILLGAMLPNLMKPFKPNVIHLKNHVVGIHNWRRCNHT
jgi:hypothetical protein